MLPDLSWVFTNMIDSFNGRYRFLSNFYPNRVCYRGLVYRTAEHAYQCAKTIDITERHAIRKSRTSYGAKKLGRRATLREDWEDTKIEVMRAIVLCKFEQDEELRNDLIATDDQELVEGNHWHDTFWGVCDGEGENHLGRILMEVRELLQ